MLVLWIAAAVSVSVAWGLVAAALSLHSPCAAAAPMSNNTTKSCAGWAIVLSFCTSCRLGSCGEVWWEC